MALDAKINLDDDSMFRRPALRELRDRAQEGRVGGPRPLSWTSLT